MNEPWKYDHIRGPQKKPSEEAVSSMAGSADVVIDRWHRGEIDGTLADALGYTNEDYEKFVETGQEPNTLREPERD